jgi:hypothetical protein
MLNFAVYLSTSGRRKHTQKKNSALGLYLALYGLFPGTDGYSYLHMTARSVFFCLYLRMCEGGLLAPQHKFVSRCAKGSSEGVIF